MAVYSDLLFTVGGDPIDVRASIYENFARIVNKNKKLNQRNSCDCYYINFTFLPF
jgi:hypothetical protein